MIKDRWSWGRCCRHRTLNAANPTTATVANRPNSSFDESQSIKPTEVFCDLQGRVAIDITHHGEVEVVLALPELDTSRYNLHYWPRNEAKIWLTKSLRSARFWVASSVAS